MEEERYSDEVYAELAKVYNNPHGYKVVDMSTGVAIDTVLNVNSFEEMQTLAENLDLQKWRVTQTLDIYSIQRPFAAFKNHIQKCVDDALEAGQYRIESEMVWTTWLQSRPVEEYPRETTKEDAIRIMEHRFDPAFRCHGDAPSWFIHPNTPTKRARVELPTFVDEQPPITLQPFVTPLPFKPWFSTNQGVLYEIVDMATHQMKVRTKINNSTIALDADGYDHHSLREPGTGRPFKIMYYNNETELLEVHRRGGDNLAAEIALLKTLWMPTQVPQSGERLDARPDHLYAKQIVDWMTIHNNWMWMKMTSDPKPLALIPRAGLPSTQEFSKNLYARHNLWNSQWWKPAAWIETDLDSRNCLEECLYRGIIRICVVTIA